MNRKTVTTLRKQKQRGEKIVCLTCYDASFAAMFHGAGIDVALVGDSLGMVIQGQASTLPVKHEQVVYHVEAVARGLQEALLIADLPFMTYATPQETMHNAAVLMRAGAHMVKLEGGDWLLDTIRLLGERGVPVCAHLGLLPQSVNLLGGYKVQGRGQNEADALVRQAHAVQEAGARLLVLESVPASLAARVTQELTIPVIGIGAGPDTDGQILVLYDLLGISTGYIPKFARNFLPVSADGSVQGAFKAYADAVREGSFPGPEHTFR